MPCRSTELFAQRFVKVFDQNRKHMEARSQRKGTPADFTVMWSDYQKPLVVAVISVDGYPFMTFSNLNCHLEDMGIGIFCLHCAT